jgi:hypothetical protein
MKILEYIDEIMAIILIVGCICLLAMGIDSEVKSILSVAAGWLFGKRMASMRRRK